MVKTILDIDGMMCGMCESHMNDAIRNAFEVEKVTSSHTKGTTEIISKEPLSREALTEAVEKTGYKILEVNEEEYTKKKFSLFGK